MKNILLIGLGRFGRHIALQLNKLGHEVMAVDINEERVNESLPIVTNAQIGDSTNTEFLRSLGIGNFDVCIVTIGGNFQNSLETTSLLKELGAKLVVSRAERDVQEKFLLRNGADEVIYPEKQVANWAAIRYTADHIRDYIEVDEGHAIFEVEVPKDGSAKPSENWISAENTASILWQPRRTEKSIWQFHRKPFLRTRSLFWFSVLTKNCKSVFAFNRGE